MCKFYFCLPLGAATMTLQYSFSENKTSFFYFSHCKTLSKTPMCEIEKFCYDE